MIPFLLNSIELNVNLFFSPFISTIHFLLLRSKIDFKVKKQFKMKQLMTVTFVFLTLFSPLATSNPIVKVPALEVLRNQIKQIRDYQNLMDRLDEYEDDLSYQPSSSVIAGGLVADPLPLPLPVSSSTNNQPSQGLTSLVTPNVLVLDVPRSIYQSIRTFNNWLDRIFGLGWRQARI